MGTSERKGEKLIEIRRKSGSVWGVYDEDGNIVPRKIISVGNTPGSGKIAFSKNLHIHVECADAFAEQIRYAAALENPERILSYDVLPEDD